MLLLLFQYNRCFVTATAQLDDTNFHISKLYLIFMKAIKNVCQKKNEKKNEIKLMIKYLLPISKFMPKDENGTDTRQPFVSFIFYQLFKLYQFITIGFV